jgi:hypothetical protein
MSDKEFVSYEQALALKELGFDKECFATWNGDTLDMSLQIPSSYFTQEHVYGWFREKYTQAPLKQQVFRWFRKKYDAHMHPTKLMPGVYIIHYGIWTSITFNTYEEAESACIDKFIELAKQQKNEQN